MKKLVFFSFAILALTSLVGCGSTVQPPHAHTFSKEWSSDAEYHWHAATCEHTDLIKDKEAHKWDDGERIDPSLGSEDIFVEYTCTVCGYKKRENIGKQEPRDDKGRLILNLRNVYFEMYDGSDIYTEFLNNKFGVNIRMSSYDYSSWNESVMLEINQNNLPDSFHFNLSSSNYGSTYKKWAEEGMLKPLPNDMTRWPNLQNMINNTSNINALKIDGKLYAIPVANDISKPNKDFSNHTYIYRRDLAKAIDEANKNIGGYTPVYKEGDVYTWEEFNRLLEAFRANPPADIGNRFSPLVDENWGFPSVTNFYKDVPHCYAKDDSGRAINAFTSDKYVSGLEVAKTMVSGKIYSPDQYNFEDSRAQTIYIGGYAGVVYTRIPYNNYLNLRKQFARSVRDVNPDDGMAILKIKGPDGKFALEGCENWYSMTLFNSSISDEKLSKILDLMDYLLSEEGTRLAVYGIEGLDYSVVDGEVVLNEEEWEKDSSGNYAPKENGAKYLRYMATLGNDTREIDPYTNLEVYSIVSAWEEEMLEAKNNGQLRIVKEPADIAWMSTPMKDEKTEALLYNGKNYVSRYAFGRYDSIDSYKAAFNNNSNWNAVLAEINARLGF